MKKVKDQFQKDLKTVSDKVTNLEKSYADAIKQKDVLEIGFVKNVNMYTNGWGLLKIPGFVIM
jgi:hypothetical protein